MTSVCSGAGCASLAELDRQAAPPVLINPDGTFAAVPHPPMTLPRFLGADVVVRRSVLLGQVVREKAARVVPALEPKPLSLPLSHPANAESPSPTVAAAHQVKKEKVAAAAKVKAVGVIAGAGCTGNPHVEAGLLAALGDPAEAVRVAAVEAILASRRGCDVACTGCCSEAIRAKLTKMVFEQTGPCCYLEPSSKARRLARLALDQCGGPVDLAGCNCGDENGLPMETPPTEWIEQIMLE